MTPGGSGSSFLYEMRLSMGFGLPQRVTKSRGEFDARMAEHWIDSAHATARDAFWEAPGFADDRRSRGRSIHGREKPYGMGSREHWRYVWLAMKAALWSGVHDAMGTTYETTEGGSNSVAVITGLTV